MADSRNPYVLLGIPFGAPRDAATRAFARRAKGKRHVPGAAAELTELTWALNQVQENIREPRTALHVYRVPADPGAIEPVGIGVLRPPPELLARATGPSSPSWSRLLDAARTEATALVHEDIASSNTLPQR